MPFDFSFGTTPLSLDSPLLHNPNELIPIAPEEHDPAINGHRLITGPDGVRAVWNKKAMPLAEFYDLVFRLGGGDAVSVDGYIRMPRNLPNLAAVEWEDYECVLHTPTGVAWGPLWEYRRNVEIRITDIYFWRESQFGG